MWLFSLAKNSMEKGMGLYVSFEELKFTYAEQGYVKIGLVKFNLLLTSNLKTVIYWELFAW